MTTHDQVDTPKSGAKSGRGPVYVFNPLLALAMLQRTRVKNSEVRIAAATLFQDIAFRIQAKAEKGGHATWQDSYSAILDRHPYLKTEDKLRTALAMLTDCVPPLFLATPDPKGTIYSFADNKLCLDALLFPKKHRLRLVRARQFGLVAAVVAINLSFGVWAIKDNVTSALGHLERTTFGPGRIHVTVASLRRALHYLSTHAIEQALSRLIANGVIRRVPFPAHLHRHKPGRDFIIYEFVRPCDAKAYAADQYERDGTTTKKFMEHLMPAHGIYQADDFEDATVNPAPLIEYNRANPTISKSQAYVNE